MWYKLVFATMHFTHIMQQLLLFIFESAGLLYTCFFWNTPLFSITTMLAIAFNHYSFSLPVITYIAHAFLVYTETITDEL